MRPDFFRTAAVFAHHGAAAAAHHHVTLAETYTGRGWVTAWLITVIVLGAIVYGAARLVLAITDGLHNRRARREAYADLSIYK